MSAERRVVLWVASVVVSLLLVVPTLDDGSTASLGILVLPLLVAIVYLALRVAVGAGAWAWARRG